MLMAGCHNGSLDYPNEGHRQMAPSPPGLSQASKMPSAVERLKQLQAQE